VQATLATTQSSLDEMVGQAQQRNQQIELLQQRVEVRGSGGGRGHVHVHVQVRAGWRTCPLHAMCDHVQVLSQEKVQLLKEAAHAQNVQQLYEKVRDQTHEVQLESQRVLRAVEQVTIVGLAIASKVET
jgi:hypothetical protein